MSQKRKAETSLEHINPLKKGRLAGILKKEGDTSIYASSPCKSVTFPPPSNMRETLAALEDNSTATLLTQLESLHGASLVMWLGELQAHISLLDRRPAQIGQGGQGVESLVTELLKLSWADKEDSVAETYTSFLSNLVSACPCYTRPVVRSLFSLFKPKGDVDERETDSLIFRRAHTALEAILEVSPVGARDEVLKQMDRSFPFFKAPAHRQVCYVSALLQMTSYVADSHQIILSTIVEKMVKIDAHLNREYIEEYLRLEESQEGEGEDPLVLSLDLLMKLMLTFIKENTHTKGEFDGVKAESVGECFIQIYISHLLPTHNIVHTQYLLFYLANLSSGLCARFLAATWRIFSSPNSASILRQTAMSYLASFLSRSNIVTTPQVLGHLTKLTAWVHSYVRNREQEGQLLDFMYTDLARHGPFYAASQAIFYIFAFRHQELVSSPNRLKIIQGLAWHSLVACSLNPLRVCLPGVVRNFSACARHYQLAYCQAVIERNNRINLPVVGSLSSTSQDSKPLLLDCFFPFDPCLLRRTKTWVQPSYMEYRGLGGILEHEEEDEEESDQEDMKEEKGDIQPQDEGTKLKRKRLDSERSSISSLGSRSRRDSVGCLSELLLSDLPTQSKG